MCVPHRKVNEALKKQVDRLWHTTNIYMHPNIHLYAKKLTSKLPGKLKVCVCVRVCAYYIVNHGQLHESEIYIITAREIVQNSMEVCAALSLPPLQVAYFTNSGSEANDLAILMARIYTGNWDVIGLRFVYTYCIQVCVTCMYMYAFVVYCCTTATLYMYMYMYMYLHCMHFVALPAQLPW